MITLEVKGLKELEKALLELPAQASASVLAGALRDAAKPVRDEAARLAPVGKFVRLSKKKHRGRWPGTLRKSIVIRIDRAKLRNDWTASAFVGFLQAAYYGTFVEFGTSKMAAQPFLRPAMESQKEAALRIFADRLRARIEKVKAKRAT